MNLILNQAQRAAQDLSLTASAPRAQFFTSCTIYEFKDGSRLTVCMSGRIYAE